jgi:hypothetical protein
MSVAKMSFAVTYIQNIYRLTRIAGRDFDLPQQLMFPAARVYPILLVAANNLIAE